MRLFIAVNFPDEVKDALCHDIAALRGRSVSGTFSRRENLHLTLAFLGEVHPRRVMDIRRAIEAADFQRCAAVIEGFGSFGGRDGESLFWRSMKLPPEFSAAQRKLCADLREADFALDNKPFKPHITLARRCVTEAGFSKQTFSSELSDIPLDIAKISLMRSDRPGGVLTYTEMYALALK